jgi:Zn-dependent peptidase ImmA (M78 family)
MKAGQIIELVKTVQQYYQTSDPFAIAQAMHIDVQFRKSEGGFTANAIRAFDHAIIVINEAYDEMSRNLLCAHELAHLLMHQEQQVNYYNHIKRSQQVQTEYEANLFTVALLFPVADLNIPLESMNGYLLQTLVEQNLHKVR